MLVEVGNQYASHPYGYFEEDEDSVPENPYLDEEEPVSGVGLILLQLIMK